MLLSVTNVTLSQSSAGRALRLSPFVTASSHCHKNSEQLAHPTPAPVPTFINPDLHGGAIILLDATPAN